MVAYPFEYESGGGLRVAVSRENGVTQVILSGDIDETSELTQLVDQIESPAIVDTYRVQRINSVGVSEWVQFIRALCQRAEVTLVRCSPALVNHMNMIDNFVASAKVKSVAIPLYCPACDEGEERAIELPDGKMTDPGVLLEQGFVCSRCQEEQLEFDDLPERYFSFLSHR